MKAVIMAGGEGIRLRPLTCNIPKPMIPLLDKPVMEYSIELLKRNGITDIAVTLQYLPDEIMNYFGDGKEFGVNLRYYVEDYPLGTAGSIKNAENFLDDTFVVISGDALTDLDILEAVRYHRDKNATGTIVLKSVTVPLEYGVVVTDDKGRIAEFLEKPSWGEVFSDKVNTGIYVFEPEIFKYYERNVKFDFSGDLFPILLNRTNSLYGYVTDCYWCDIGNVEQYSNCQFDILKGAVKVNIKGEKIGEGIWINKKSEISPKTQLIPPIYVGENCNIYEQAELGPFCILGGSNIISNGSNISRTIILRNCYVGSYCRVKGAILCNKVQLRSKAAISEECIIGDESLIGEKASIKPGVKIWPNKKVEAAAVVKTNIIWGGRYSRTLFGKQGVSGEINVDITPEFVSRLGSAYGSILNPESKVAISCTDSGAAQMFKYSLAAGLLSMGVEVYDLMKMTTPMTRQAVSFLGVQGGIHVIVNNENYHKVSILFMDENGLNIDSAVERKIESSFVREDYRRIKADLYRKIIPMNDCREYYTWQLLNQLSVHTIREKRFKVVLSVSNPLLLSVIDRIFSELRINVRLYYESKDIVGLKETVLKFSADLGIYLSEEGDRAVIVDEKGNLIKDELFEALNALVILKTARLKTLVVPITASLCTERVAFLCGAKYIKTKTSQKNILDAYLKNETRLGKREIINAYLMSLDAVSVVALTLNMMSSSGKTLSSLLAEIPHYFCGRLEVSCPWDMRGKVMRTLIEENHCKTADLIEGLRFNYEDAWALVLPDAEEPICRIYAEASESNIAESICGELAAKVEALISGNVV